MLKRNLIPVWVGIILLSGMFLLGQGSWSPECIDGDGDGYGNPASMGCDFPALDCNDSLASINPGASERYHDETTSCNDGVDNDCNNAIDNNDTKCDANDLDMSPLDFDCITDWDVGDVYRIKNLRGNITEALAVANSPTGGTFPLGTVIQLIPTEAMVKRAEGWNPITNDWEFIELSKNATRTLIIERGGEEVVHFTGATCFSCHSVEAIDPPDWDLICRKTHGCEPLIIPFTDPQLIAIQDTDPRCQ